MISLCSFHGHKEYRRRRRRRARKCTCRKNCWPDDRCLHLLIYLNISAGPGISLKYLPTNSTSNIVPEEQHWAEMKATEHGATGRKISETNSATSQSPRACTTFILRGQPSLAFRKKCLE